MLRKFSWLSLCLLFLFCSCRSVPISSRRQLLLSSESQEMALGASAYSEYKAEFPVSKNKTYVDALNRVGQAIQQVAEKPDYQWEFVVLESDTANAFCLPGGKVAVYSGLFQFVENDAELATVVSHEVAHAIARHGGERMSWAAMQQMGQLGIKSAGGGELAELVYGFGTQLGVMLPFSRKHENEADAIGLMLMAKAGYHPQAAVSFWKKFGGDKNPSIIEQWTSTHPGGQERITRLGALQAEAMLIYQQIPNQKGLGQKIK